MISVVKTEKNMFDEKVVIERHWAKFTQFFIFIYIYIYIVCLMNRCMKITCSSSSSAYFWRLNSFTVPSLSSLSREASCLAAFISSLSFCSRFTFSTSTVRCSSCAICSLRRGRGTKLKLVFHHSCEFCLEMQVFKDRQSLQSGSTCIEICL